MQSSALAFASICGGDLTSIMYSKYYNYINFNSVIGIHCTVYELGLFHW